MSLHRNRVQMTVTGTPGTGTITLSAATSGYQSFASAYGANATVDILIAEGNNWEVARNCTYTNSGATVTRGTLEASSTGSAVSFGSGAVVSVIATAASGNNWGLNEISASPTSAGVTGVVGTLHLLNISGLTASRDFTLPATCAVGDRVGVFITTGDDAFELSLKPATGDTINGGSPAAEWSRLFISNECVIFRCVTANADWIVEYDGRIPAQISVRNDGTTAQSIGAVSFVKLQAALDAEDQDIGDSWDNANGRFTARRDGTYLCTAHAQLSSVADQTSLITSLRKNGTDYAHLGRAYASANSQNPGCGGAMAFPLADGDYVEVFVYNSNTTNAYNTVVGAERIGFSCAEVLP